MSSAETQREKVKLEKEGPGLDLLGLPNRQRFRLIRGGIRTIEALQTALEENLLPNRIGPKSLQIIQDVLDTYTQQARR